MTNAHLLTLFLALTALFAAGCGDTTEAPADQTQDTAQSPAADPAPAPPARSAPATTSKFGQTPPEDTIATAFGRGKFTADDGQGVSFTFDANFTQGGDATGALQFSRFDDDGKLDVTADITCGAYDTDQGRAWIGGRISTNNSTAARYKSKRFNPGADVWFRFSESMKHPEPPAKISMAGFAGDSGGNAKAFCAAKNWPADGQGLFDISSDSAVILFALPGAQ